MLKKAFFWCLGGVLLFHIPATAQQFRGHAGVDMIGDNREFFNTYMEPQTILGIRGTGSVGLTFDKAHEIQVGGRYFHEFGSHFNKIRTDLLLYYHFQKDDVAFWAGAFPREALNSYPRALIQDSIRYFRPTVQGFLVEIDKNWGEQQVWLDWTSRQTDTERETFAAGWSGEVQWKWLFFRHFSMMYHYAGPGIPIPGDALRDNAGIFAGLGVHLGEQLGLDSLSLVGGPLLSFDRYRGQSDWQKPVGFRAQLNAQYHSFGLQHEFYAGDAHALIWGDRFYRADRYNRLDLYWQFFDLEYITGKFVYAFHWADGRLFHNQLLNLTVKIP